MFEKIFLWIIFTISTNFFYILIFPTIVTFPVFFGWLFPSQVRLSLALICVPLMLIYGYLAFTKLEPVLKWIHHTGETGEIVFSEYYATGNTINDQPEMAFAGTLKTQSGELYPFRISAGGILSYPFDNPFALTTHTVFPVKYRPSYPQFWILDRGSQEAVHHRKSCQELKARQNELKALLLLKPDDPALKDEFLKNEKELSEKNCNGI